MAEENGSEIFCRVMDDGPGMGPELGASTKEGVGGKGLFLTGTLLGSFTARVTLDDSGKVSPD